MRKVLKTYIRISKSKKYKNLFTINGEQPVEKVSQDIIKIVDELV